MIKSLWGMEGRLEGKVARISQAGYNGVEMRIPPHVTPLRLRSLLRDARLDLVVAVSTDGEDHVASLQAQVEQALAYNPLHVNSHSGRDFWSLEQRRMFLAAALEIEARCGVPINHETHRGRIFYNPWHTAELLEEFPELGITADFSHFVLVCERLLSDPELKSALDLCCSRARHIHGRVGYEEGPQVNDPRAPEWKAQLEAHEAWWSSIIRGRLAAGAEYLSFNPEFGPADYMQTLPYSRMPVSDLWEICLWMATRFSKQFQQVSDSCHQ